MIGYLRGELVTKSDGVAVVNVNGIGYEVHLPAYVDYCLRDRRAGQEIELYILYHHPEQQPRPRLFGFRNDAERQFFLALTTVQDIGPTKALAVFTSPVSRIAKAIAEGDETTLTRIKGVGPAMARKIIAGLSDKVGKFALLREEGGEIAPASLDEVDEDVLAALTGQLGHGRQEAQRLVQKARERNPDISTAEELFEEIYRGEKS